MSLLRTLALLLTAGALLDGAIAADAPGSSLAAPPAQAITSRAVMTGEQVMRILDETVDWYRANEAWWRKIQSGEYRDYYRKMYEGREVSVRQ